MIDQLTEDQRKVLIIWLFLGLFLAALLLIFANKKMKAKSNYQLDNNYNVVSNYSRYYTITKIIDKYYNAINEGNYDGAFKMLDDKYIKSNNLSTNSFKESFNYDAKIAFRGGLMCSKRFAKGYTSYYVSGSIIGANSNKQYSGRDENIPPCGFGLIN